MKNKALRIFIGIIIILLGIGILGQVFGLWDVIGFKGWWTLFIIIPAICLIIKFGIRFWNTAILAFGVAFLCAEMFSIKYSSAMLMVAAVLIIYCGIRLLIGPKPKKSFGFPQSNDPGDYSTNPKYSQVFSREYVKNAAERLQGAEIVACFGSVEADFSAAEVKSDIEMSAEAIFGGVQITAPRNCRIIVNKTGVFGGCANNAVSSLDENAPTLTINATSVFGGIEIK